VTDRLDLVLLGATGVSGALVAEHLARAGSSSASPMAWGLAGRREAALHEARARLAQIDPRLAKMPLFVGDVRTVTFAREVSASARVIGTTVGPFDRLGRELVRACAEAGTDYADLAGEPLFIRHCIDRLDAIAKSTGARLISACGFDSVPFDLGVHALSTHMMQLGDRLSRAESRITRLRGGFSGGTLATLVDTYARANDEPAHSILRDPHGLDPEPRNANGARDQLGPKLDVATGHWTAPFVMAPINTRIVRRTNALLGHPYGTEFRYDEALDTGPGPMGFARASFVSSALASLYGASTLPISRKVLERLLPALGDGEIGGYYRVEIRGTSAEGRRARMVIEGEEDPGYQATAKMLGEALLCLVAREPCVNGGVWTPASAMGDALLTRLRRVGIRFTLQVPRVTRER
jgi:short subunit dehydrogenase-like uncharacterized protein